MPFLRILLDTKRVTEFQIQLIGMMVLTISLFFAGIALQFKSLFILYFLFAIPAGFSGLAVYQRLVFIHMGWFKKIGRQHLGAGIFGGAIGFWTVLFFLLSVPILQALPIYHVLYIYATLCPVHEEYHLSTYDSYDPPAGRRARAIVTRSRRGRQSHHPHHPQHQRKE